MRVGGVNSTFRSVTVTEGRWGLPVKFRKSMRRPAVRRIDGETARESLLAVAPQGRGIDSRAGAVAAFEPDGAFEPLVVAVERIDEVFERKLVVARLDVERENSAAPYRPATARGSASRQARPG